MKMNVSDLDILFLGFYLDPYLLKSEAATGGVLLEIGVL